MEGPVTTQLELAAILIALSRKPRVWERMDQVLLQAFRQDRPYWDSDDDLKSTWSNLPLADKKSFVEDYALTISKQIGLALDLGAEGDFELPYARDIEPDDAF
jgi:hypothetical protein